MLLVCGITLWQGFAAGVTLGVLLSMVIFVARMNRSLLRSRLTEQRLHQGEALFRQGDAADGLYVLTLGSVSVIGHDGGRTQRYLSLSPGMMVGETAWLDGGNRSADAVADDFVAVHHLGSAALARLEAEHPAIALRLQRNIAVHLSRRLRAVSAAWQASQG